MGAPTIKRRANIDHDTREQLIRAGIKLFSIQGFDAPSIRDLTSAAGVNQAAINYHFGSKEGLITAIFEELASPLIHARLDALDALESQAAGGPVPLEALVQAFIEPFVRRAKQGNNGDRELSRLLLIASSVGSPALRNHIETMHDQLAHRFVAALSRTLPHLSRTEILWRYKFGLGALLYTLADHMQNYRLKRLSEGACNTDDPDEIIAHLVPYVTVGFARSH